MTRRAEDGFALVTTLWFLALLALVTVIVEGWVASALGNATALRERVETDAELIGITDRIAYTMVTGGWSTRGLELVPPTASGANRNGAEPAASMTPETPFIALDARPYRFGDIVVRLQDEGGLYDLSDPDRGVLEKLLHSYGVAPLDADRLRAALVAYAKQRADPRKPDDADAVYGQAGLPLPRHAPLLTPWELCRVLGWARPGMWQAASSFGDLATTGPVGGVNVNTAPAKVLAAATGIDEREAARIVAARSARPIADIRDIPGGAAALADVDRPLSTLPLNIIRLRLTATGDPLAHIVALRLTPGGAAPYRIDWIVALPQNAGSAAATSLPNLPAAAGQ